MTIAADSTGTACTGICDLCGRTGRQDAADPLTEFVGDERLGQIVCGAELEGPDDIGFPFEGRQHDDRRRIRGGSTFQSAQNFKSVHYRHHGVEHDQVRLVVLNGRQHARTILQRQHFMTISRETILKQRPKQVVVINDKNSSHWMIHAYISAPPKVDNVPLQGKPNAIVEDGSAQDAPPHDMLTTHLTNVAWIVPILHHLVECERRPIEDDQQGRRADPIKRIDCETS